MGTMQYQRQLSSRVHASVCPEGSSGSLDSSIRNQGKKCRRLEASLRGHMRPRPKDNLVRRTKMPGSRRTNTVLLMAIHRKVRMEGFNVQYCSGSWSKKIVQQLAVASNAGIDFH